MPFSGFLARRTWKNAEDCGHLRDWVSRNGHFGSSVWVGTLPEGRPRCTDRCAERSKSA